MVLTCRIIKEANFLQKKMVLFNHILQILIRELLEIIMKIELLLY